MTDDPCSSVAAAFRYRHEAELAKGYLDDAGIPAALMVDDAGGAYAGLDFGGNAARLLVRPDDLREARRVLVDSGVTEAEVER